MYILLCVTFAVHNNQCLILICLRNPFRIMHFLKKRVGNNNYSTEVSGNILTNLNGSALYPLPNTVAHWFSSNF